MNELFFKEIKKTDHYVENHEESFSWSQVIEIILTTKQKRKKGDRIEIETDRYYILCELKENALYIINAKYK